MARVLRRGLQACIGASVLMHAALAAWWAQPGAGSGPVPHRPTPAASVIELRVAPAESAPPGRVPAAVAAASAPAVSASLLASPDSIDVEEMPSALEPLVRPAVEPLAALAPALEGGFDEQSYVPRPRLTVPPALQGSVLLSWPPHDAPPAGRYAGVLSLFIDEFGVVQRVRVEDGELPAALQEQARAVFLGAQFSPGQIQGQVVRSRIRIEVSFEADPRVLRKGVGP